MTWKRSEVDVGDIFTRDSLREEEPLLYRVISISDEPTVVLRPVFEREGEDLEHYVISSSEFAEWTKVVERGSSVNEQAKPRADPSP